MSESKPDPRDYDIASALLAAGALRNPPVLTPDVKAGELLYCPACGCKELHVAHGGVAPYECHECGALINDPNRDE